MDTPTTLIILRGGPAHREVHREVPVACMIYTRLAKDPGARYRDSGAIDGSSRRVFEHCPELAGAAGGPTGR